VNNRQCVLKKDDPKARNSLQNKQQKSPDSKTPQPMTTLLEPKCQGQRNGQQADG
jgi:hypothetical protein